MERTLSQIIGKANDFKICKGCNIINWYENEECHNCRGKSFKPIGQGIVKMIESDYDFYKKEGYDENEIDEITIDV
jgi:RNA polymerase subunit RPABC4/transcription elongation factor Spt4